MIGWQRSRPPGIRPWFLAFALVCLALCECGVGISRAQTPGSAVDPTATPSELPSLVITSEPTGAVVTLRGPYEWVGQTPWQLYREVSGLYRVEARLPGYESYESEVTLGAGGVRELRIQLSRRTRLKAASRSMLFPGWGQAYNGSRGKGLLMSFAALGAGAGLLVTHEMYNDDLDTFNERKRAYERSTRQGDLQALHAAVEDASDDAERAYDRRQVVGAIALGVYAASVLDAIFFFPSGEATPSSLARSEPAGPARAGFGWTADMVPGTAARAGLTYSWQ